MEGDKDVCESNESQGQYCAVWFENGQKKPALCDNDNGTSTSAYAIAVSGSNIHIAGTNSTDAVYWLNGNMQRLPKTKTMASPEAIAVSWSDVYIVGYESDYKGNVDAVYWLNGAGYTLPKTAGLQAVAHAIFVD